MEQLIVISPEDLLRLVTHYDQGQNIPLNIDLLGVGLSPYLQRWLMLECTSSDWPTGNVLPDGSLPPIHIRYDGRHTLAVASLGQDLIPTPMES